MRSKAVTAITAVTPFEIVKIAEIHGRAVHRRGRPAPETHFPGGPPRGVGRAPTRADTITLAVAKCRRVGRSKPLNPALFTCILLGRSGPKNGFIRFAMGFCPGG